MSNKELYKQKMQAQLDEWEADIDKLKAKAAGANASAKLEWHKDIDALKVKIAHGKTKLTEIENASDEAWESIKEGADTAWDSLKTAMVEAKSKFKI
ncbi:MAG: coiled coil domain-containing protein [Thiotrichales bacterium]|nr:coiled coil domain-containing protein [Thiotrichales bacterium]